MTHSHPSIPSGPLSSISEETGIHSGRASGCDLLPSSQTHLNKHSLEKQGRARGESAYIMIGGEETRFQTVPGGAGVRVWWVEGTGSTLYARLIMWLTASVDGITDC
ncbi:hypothetical protein NHX12_005810 [Muraenolepis orangiensis]|uniref:Uncharacterized protein n=1 Tax=Muraenolepis orangiensis TaxID=630683 RepID=A0A9Q0DTK7_9TELE|nr:hypothetical protein NHX12_005810 [Muraenolepis orangiensis]